MSGGKKKHKVKVRRAADVNRARYRPLSFDAAAMQAVPDDAVTRVLRPPGYHLRQIEKGVLGEVSKIVEETEELRDAAEQGVKIMELVELSDLLGAIEAYLDAHLHGFTLDDLIAMNNVTQRAFRNGHRS